eukprot:447152-Pelagomonas_calceolata.AAC.1
MSSESQISQTREVLLDQVARSTWRACTRNIFEKETEQSPEQSPERLPQDALSRHHSPSEFPGYQYFLKPG